MENTWTIDMNAFAESVLKNIDIEITTNVDNAPDLENRLEDEVDKLEKEIRLNVIENMDRDMLLDQMARIIAEAVAEHYAKD